MPLETLFLLAIPNVKDLSPLVEHKKLHLLINGEQPGITDDSPLMQLHIKEFIFDAAEKHVELIRSIKTLEKIDDQPVTEFWKSIKEKQKKPG